MDTTTHRSANIVAAATIFTVITQIAYLTVQGEAITATMIWGAEAVAFLAIALFALTLANGAGWQRLGWSAMALFGLFNVMQAGAGLTMFGPLDDGGEALAPVFSAVVDGAFFLFFAAKAVLGVAGMVFGLALFRHGSVARKAVGGLAALTGLAALLANLVAMNAGREMAFVAGGAGTAAALFTAIAILMLPRRNPNG